MSVCKKTTLSISLWAFRCPCLLMLFISSPMAPGRPRPDPALQLRLPSIPHTGPGIKGEACGEAGSELRNVSVITGRKVGGSREGGGSEGDRGSAVLLGCLWSGFHHPVFHRLPGDDTAAEVRASGPGRSARASNFRAGAFLNRYPRCYQRRCHVDYLTAFTDVTLGWLRSHFRVRARVCCGGSPCTHSVSGAAPRSDRTLLVHEEGPEHPARATVAGEQRVNAW